MNGFDQPFWDEHWAGADNASTVAPNPYLRETTTDLPSGTALDAGCGIGTETVWLAQHGWAVTAVDISSAAVAEGTRQATAAGVQHRVTWAVADLTVWEPSTQFDLVFSAYAHAAIPQLELYRRLADWVRPGGTIVIVAHQHASGHHPMTATVTAQSLSELLDPQHWDGIYVREEERIIHTPNRPVNLHDLILTATRAA